MIKKKRQLAVSLGERLSADVLKAVTQVVVVESIGRIFPQNTAS